MAAVLNSSIGGLFYFSRSPIRRAAGAEAFATKHRPPRLRLKRHAVSLAALIANNFESFAFGSAASTLSRPAKILAARITTRLAAFGMAQSSLAIIVLLSFSKWKAGSAFATGDFKVWHRYLPEKYLLFWFRIT